MTVTEAVQIGTFLLAILATALSLKTFSSNKKQELENHLFRIKLEAFSNIAFEIDNFFIILNRMIAKINHLQKGQDNSSAKLEELSFDVDDQIYKCHSLIVKYSVYFSVKSTEHLLAFTSNLIGDVSEEVKDRTDLLQWIDGYYEEQMAMSNKAIETLRGDLQLEKLHSSLYRRTEK